MILYIHGFGTTGLHSQKANELVDYFGEKMVLRPSWPYKPKEAFEMLSDIMQKENIKTVIGSSFGGFLELQLAQYFDANYIFINPSLIPDVTMRKALDQSITLPNGKEFTITQPFIDELAIMRKSLKIENIKQNHLYFYLSEDDEILDHFSIPSIFPKAKKIEYFKNSFHRFEKFKQIIPEIEKINNGSL